MPPNVTDAFATAAGLSMRLPKRIKGKRGTVRLDFMVGASEFTSDAKSQESCVSLDELTITLIDSNELEQWIAADDGDEFLEQVVRRAMLR
jgi:hypothetical protein